MAKQAWLVIDDAKDSVDTIKALGRILAADLVVYSAAAPAVKWVSALGTLPADDTVLALAVLNLRTLGPDPYRITTALHALKALRDETTVLLASPDMHDPDLDHYSEILQADVLIIKPLPPFFELNSLFRELLGLPST